MSRSVKVEIRLVLIRSHVCIGTSTVVPSQSVSRLLVVKCVLSIKNVVGVKPLELVQKVAKSNHLSVVPLAIYTRI